MSAPFDNIVYRIQDSVIVATKAYFQDWLKIEFLSVKVSSGDVDVISPRDITAVIGMFGETKITIAISLENDLVSAILAQETAGLGIKGDELDFYRNDVIAELANLVLGHSTKNFANQGEIIKISPPMVIEGENNFRMPKGAVFSCFSCRTVPGILDVYCISPKDMTGEIQI
jgi:CheY-specific phosphatase CheX